MHPSLDCKDQGSIGRYTPCLSCRCLPTNAISVSSDNRFLEGFEGAVAILGCFGVWPKWPLFSPNTPRCLLSKPRSKSSVARLDRRLQLERREQRALPSPFLGPGETNLPLCCWSRFWGQPDLPSSGLRIL